MRRTESEKGESMILPSRESVIERKILYSKREIPGGPDSQHHPPRKQITKRKRGY